MTFAGELPKNNHYLRRIEGNMPDDRRMAFEALVLQGLWLLIRDNCGDFSRANGWRANALGHMDQYGNQNPGAKEYRREETFPPLRG